MDIHVIAFDADDTLWHEMRKYEAVEDKFVDMLSRYVDAQTARNQMRAADVDNLKYYGFGAKGFMLSLIDAAIRISDGRVQADEIGRIIQWGRDMLDEPMDVFAHVEQTLTTLKAHYRLIMITKGDLFDQERKVERSGLGHYFEQIEIVSSKDPKTYAKILEKVGVSAENFLMIGNAIRSDILPIVEIGAHAVHIPCVHDWDFERDDSADTATFTSLEHIGQLPNFLAEYSAK